MHLRDWNWIDSTVSKKFKSVTDNYENNYLSDYIPCPYGWLSYPLRHSQCHAPVPYYTCKNIVIYQPNCHTYKYLQYYTKTLTSSYCHIPLWWYIAHDEQHFQLKIQKEMLVEELVPEIYRTHHISHQHQYQYSKGLTSNKIKSKYCDIHVDSHQTIITWRNTWSASCLKTYTCQSATRTTLSQTSIDPLSALQCSVV
jgi:hypothetical protein